MRKFSSGIDGRKIETYYDIFNTYKPIVNIRLGLAIWRMYANYDK